MSEIQELRDWSARELMGWYIVWAEDNRYEDYYSHPGKLYAEFHINLADWQPDNPETGQIWLVVERMRELGFYLQLHAYEPWEAFFSVENAYISEDTLRGFATDPKPCTAILKAAKAAWEAK